MMPWTFLFPNGEKYVLVLDLCRNCDGDGDSQVASGGGFSKFNSQLGIQGNWMCWCLVLLP